MAKKLSDNLECDEPKKPNQVILLTLPMPVSVNSMYIGIHRTNLTKKAKQWVHTAQYICKQEIAKQGWEMDMGSVWYSCELRFYFNDKRYKDSHNYLKLMLDALEGLIYKNDYFCLPRIVSVGLDRQRPRVELVIKSEIFEEGVN